MSCDSQRRDRFLNAGKFFSGFLNMAEWVVHASVEISDLCD
jgi:hypothetical protein